MLTNDDIWSLAKRMNVPLVFCDFKDQLKKTKLQYGKSYIINMEDAFSKDGKRNQGSHYCCFQVNRHPNGEKEGFYFDSFGMPQPQVVNKFCKMDLPSNSKDIQSLMNSACGWYCLALLHYINASPYRTQHLWTDLKNFIDMFEDLEKSTDHLKNEWVLKHFFRSSDPSKRTPIEVGYGHPNQNPDNIINQDEDNKKSL
jgi:hypothetical protein